MLRRIREQRYINLHVKVSLKILMQQIDEIKKRGNEIILTPKPHEHSWRGIYNGAIAFLPNRVFAIPQLFSKPVLSETEIKKLCDYIVQSGFQKIIISGYTVAFRALIIELNEAIKNVNSSAKIYLIHHSSFTSNREDPVMLAALEDILKLYKQGLIHRIGFIKKGMAETLKAIMDLNAHHLIPMSLPIPEKISDNQTMSDGIHLGVFTHFAYRKNIDNQVAAALQVKNALIHVHKKEGFEYLQNQHRIAEHEFMDDYFQFLQLIGSMSLNFYITLSECFGLFIAESLMLGVPCLASNNSGIFDYDEELKKMLVVEEYDNSDAIAKQAKNVLERRDEISRKGQAYIKKLNLIAAEKFNGFLDD